MAFINFPNQIKVKLADGWGRSNPGRGLSDIGEYGYGTGYLVLTKAWESGNQRYYTESGSISPDPSDNRIKLYFQNDTGISSNTVRVYVGSFTTGQWIFDGQWYKAAMTNYTFGQHFYGLITGVSTLKYSFLSFGSPISSYSYYWGQFNGGVFDSMEEYFPPSGRGPDKTTFRYG